MNRQIFKVLQGTRRKKRPVALITDLLTGAQSLILDGQSTTGDLETGPEVFEAVAEALRLNRGGRLPEPNQNLFVAVFNPPLRLIVVGAVHIAQILVPMASLAGYQVTVVDPRQGWGTEERFPGVAMLDDWPDDALKALAPDERTAIVTLSHDPKLDDPALLGAITSTAFYIGALGSRKTHTKRLERLATSGCSAVDLARIHAPIGLSLGGRSAAEIAIATLAQMTQVLYRANPPSVRIEAAE